MLHQHRSARLAGVLLATALVGGCTGLTVMSHVPLSTMSRLSSLKLAEIEPAELRVAARLPDALEPRPDGVTVHIDVAGQKHDKTARRSSYSSQPSSRQNWLRFRPATKSGPIGFHPMTSIA